MSNDVRLKRLEQNYELLRSELMQLKKMASEHMKASQHLDALRANELATANSEIEHLRIENTRLRSELGEKELGEKELGEKEDVTPALPWPGEPEDPQ